LRPAGAPWHIWYVLIKNRLSVATPAKWFLYLLVALGFYHPGPGLRPALSIYC
jgi:hypothetical protein